jgi:hypothetical protein
MDKLIMGARTCRFLALRESVILSKHEGCAEKIVAEQHLESLRDLFSYRCRGGIAADVEQFEGHILVQVSLSS